MPLTDPLGRPVNPNAVKVAILLPLTGQGGDLGPAMLNAAQMAVLDRGGPQFELMPRDTRGTPDGAAEAARSAVAEGAQLILGPLFSPEVGPAARVAAERGINVVAFTTDATVAGGNAFVMGILPGDQVERVVRYGVGRGLTRYGLLGPNTPYGTTVLAALQSATARHGATLTQSQLYDPNGRDIANVVQTLGSSRGAFDALMLPDTGARLRVVAPLLPYSSVQAQILGTGQWDESNVGTEPGLVGAWFAAPQPELRADFQRRYQANFGSQPPRLASLAYDAVALAAVLSQGPGASSFDRAMLTDPSGFAGIDGIFRFNQNGVSERGLAVLEVTGDGSRVIDPAPQSFAGPGF